MLKFEDVDDILKMDQFVRQNAVHESVVQEYLDCMDKVDAEIGDVSQLKDDDVLAHVTFSTGIVTWKKDNIQEFAHMVEIEIVATNTTIKIMCRLDQTTGRYVQIGTMSNDIPANTIYKN